MQLISGVELIFVFRVLSICLSLQTNVKPKSIREQFIFPYNLFSSYSKTRRRYRLDFATCQIH